MNRLSVRLFLSHLAVAVIGAVTTYAVVRLLAPTLFDSGMRMMGPAPEGRVESSGRRSFLR